MLKDIPSRVSSKIVQLLNHNTFYNWKSIAGAMGLTVGEVLLYENDNNGNGQMEGLFNRMIQQQRTVEYFVHLLNHREVQRLDIIDLLRKNGLISDVLEQELQGL